MPTNPEAGDPPDRMGPGDSENLLYPPSPDPARLCTQAGPDPGPPPSTHLASHARGRQRIPLPPLPPDPARCSPSWAGLGERTGPETRSIAPQVVPASAAEGEPKRLLRLSRARAWKSLGRPKPPSYLADASQTGDVRRPFGPLLTARRPRRRRLGLLTGGAPCGRTGHFGPISGGIVGDRQLPLVLPILFR